MKSIKFLFVVIALSSSMMTFANDDKKKVKTIVNQQIQKLLNNPEFVVKKNMTVTVELIVNRDNEIVVLSVNDATKSGEIEGYIKNRLNYKKLSERIESKIYRLPIKIIPGI